MNIKLLKSVLDANDTVARENRARLEEAGVLAVNITSAPGSGKTALLEKTIPALAKEFRSAAIVGDLQTTRDAERLGDLAVQVIQINTEGGCHLSAAMVGEALKSLKLTDLSLLFIENVGNMVCPAGFDLGERVRVAMLSVPEGDDKAGKYPTLFQAADVVLLNKVDLIGTLEYDLGRLQEDLSKLNTRAPLFRLSAKTGAGMGPWLEWLKGRCRNSPRQARAC